MTNTARKPRIALMGEFSAGKSTLSNLLLGARPLPEKVTATRLSPVWISQGNDAPYRIDVSGEEEPISLSNLEAIPVDETRVIRLFFDADILEICDLIDFPGISDPNMSSDVWQRMLDEVDAVLWCTHATQAWRQSEAAVWDSIPQSVRDRSALLITRYDKLTTPRDQHRVLARVKKETAGLFGATFPISLLQALQAGDDWEAFNDSGAGAFLEHLLVMIQDLHRDVAGMSETLYSANAPVSETADEETTPDAQPVSAVAEGPTAPEPVAMMQDVAPAAPEPLEAVSPSPTAAPKVELGAAAGKDRYAALLNSSKPVVDVSDAQPVVNLEEDTNTMTQDSSSITPRRVRPTGQSARPSRPATSGNVVDMSQVAAPASAPAAAARPDSLRSIFAAEPIEPDMDKAASS